MLKINKSIDICKSFCFFFYKTALIEGLLPALAPVESPDIFLGMLLFVK